MPPVYVLVHIYNVRLVAIAHSLHILPGSSVVQIREPVVKEGFNIICRTGFFCILVGKQVVVKRPQGLLHDTLRVPRHIGNHAVPVNDAGCIVHFLLVVDDCTVGEAPLLILATISSSFPLFYQIVFFKLTGQLHDNPLAQQH